MSRRSNILVVDDDLAVRLRVGDLLRSAGDFTVNEAGDGRSGLALAMELKPDLVLLDIMMPGMTGLEVCAALRARSETREVPIIILSAAEESEAMLAALEAGADDFLRKPFYAPELRAKVQTITRLNRARALAGERDRFRWLLDHSLEPLVIADGKGALLYANSRARELFDLGEETGIDVVTAISRHYRAEPADAWAAWRELRLPPGEPFAIFQPETEQVGARWYQVELHALDAESSQVLIKFTNRSGMVRHELETFTFQHLISHKIRTPLNGLAPILSFLSSADRERLPEDVSALLDLAHQSAERLERTLTGVLSYHAAVFAPLDGTALQPRQSLIHTIAEAAETSGLKGRVTFSGPSRLTCTPELMEVVLGELFENYTKFSDAGEAGLEVALSWEHSRWELRLFAPGKGLPPDVLARLARPYGQLESKFTGEVPGIGLGLATVRLLLRSRGGDISFENHKRLTGLVTTVSVPRAFFSAETDHAHEQRND